MSQQEIDFNLVHKIFNKNIRQIIPILNKGEVNRVYIVEMDDNKTVVRLNDEYEITRFKKEQWCMQKASEIGVLSPQVLDVGAIDGIAYMKLEYISGLNGKEIVENESYIWKTLGVYAKKIHEIPTEGFGEGMTKDGKFNDTWERYLTYNIESLNSSDKLVSMNILNHSQSQKLRKRFQTFQQKKFKFGLTHGDLSLANIIVEGDKITLIDWGSAESTIIPHLEIIGILEDSLEETNPLFGDFLEGYGLSMEDYTNMRDDIVSLTLLRAIDKLRWAIDKKPEVIEEFSQKINKLTSQYLLS